MNNNKSGKVYIYNVEQANFFIKNGCNCIETGIHFKTNKVFYVFKYSEYEIALIKWNNNKIN